MIIDCHGHYTTAPKELGDYRDQQKADLKKNPQHQAQKGTLTISDDQLRDSVENAQLKLQRERGTDVTIFQPARELDGSSLGQCVDEQSLVGALQRPDLSAHDPVSEEFRRCGAAAAIAGRADRIVRSRAHALRRGARLRRLQFEPRHQRR
jgi:hypothetical protein